MSLKLGRFFGINLYLHWSFWLLPLWLVLTNGHDPDADPLGLRLLLLAALFAFVVLHEYGHALMARSFGIATRDVTLYPIGGVARLERMSEKPWEEFWIAIAGPLVNFVSAGALAFVMFLAPLHGLAGELVQYLFGMNIVLFVFNLLPAFPMDGGRVLRALLAVPLDRLTATRVAVYVSVAVALVMGAAGVWFLHSPWPVLIGLFVIWAGHQELRMLELQREHPEEAEPHYEQPEPRPSAWSGVPRGAVMVYIWDPRTHQWIPQGVVPTHGYSGPGRPVG
jgi:Zn-dependent protease